MGLHPIAGHFLSEHYLLVPETFSYYGPWNLLTYNVGYHVEHHDFPNIPSSLLPEVRRIAAEFYEPLCYHTSWTRALLRYILDPRMGPFARIRRKERGMAATSAAVKRQHPLKTTHRDCWFSEFTCRSGQCIQAYGVCNGIKDCLDEATDEAQCHEQ
ncbi:PREDICTED: sphingolipid delta(4)-desaturase DES1-like, partial [Rhagoletis zephyria]|uniref:sphingolipid delta(4)-desaturase DES1-like n=1 Tax=Rhagoletis zephyria TaxID=28612 RepID=UPI0008118396